MPNSEMSCASPSIDPVGIENLVAAVLGIGLREHHQFDVGGIALQLGEVLHQIFDLVGGKRQTQFAVGGLQCGVAAIEDIHAGQRLRCAVCEYFFFNSGDIAYDGFGHAVVQQRQHGFLFDFAQRFAVPGPEVIHHAAFDARTCGKAQ